MKINRRAAREIRAGIRLAREYYAKRRTSPRALDMKPLRYDAFLHELHNLYRRNPPKPPKGPSGISAPPRTRINPDAFRTIGG